MSPKKSASSSETLSGILVRPLSAKGTRTYSAWQPSMRQPSSQPPSSQLLINPCWQNQHSPQKVMQLAATGRPDAGGKENCQLRQSPPQIRAPARRPVLHAAPHRFDVQVAGADGRAGHPDNGVAGLLEFWRFTFPQGELPLPAVDQRHHRSFHIDRMLLSVVYRSYTTSSDGSTVKPCA